MKISSPTRIRKEDVKPEFGELVDVIAGAVNDFNEQVYNALSGGIDFSNDGKSLFFSQSTYDSSADIYRLDLASNRVERWTESEQGEMQKSDMSQPKLIYMNLHQKIKNFWKN